jgi:hypothetical protein
MARPTTIKMGEGEVVLRNLPKEEVERIKALLNPSIENSPEVQNAIEQVVEKMDEINYNLPLDETALGFRQNNSGSYELVSVKYNVDSKQATVESVKNLGKDKQVALYDFKIKIGILV